jgi:hypothetical protein
MTTDKTVDTDAEDGYICSTCADKRGWRWPGGHLATMHYGPCPDCKVRSPLAAHTDWLKPGEKVLKMGSWD